MVVLCLRILYSFRFVTGRGGVGEKKSRDGHPVHRPHPTAHGGYHSVVSVSSPVLPCQLCPSVQEYPWRPRLVIVKSFQVRRTCVCVCVSLCVLSNMASNRKYPGKTLLKKDYPPYHPLLWGCAFPFPSPFSCHISSASVCVCVFVRSLFALLLCSIQIVNTHKKGHK